MVLFVLFQYAIFLIVIIIVEVILAVCLFVYADNIKNGLKSSLDKTFDSTIAPNPFHEIERQVTISSYLFFCSLPFRISAPIIRRQREMKRNIYSQIHLNFEDLCPVMGRI